MRSRDWIIGGQVYWPFGKIDRGKGTEILFCPRRSPLRLQYKELINQDKASLDIFWLKDESLEESDNLPDPDVLAQEIVEDLDRKGVGQERGRVCFDRKGVV